MKKVLVLFISIFFIFNIFCNKFSIYNKSNEKITIQLPSSSYDVEAGKFFKITNATSFNMFYNDLSIKVDFEDRNGIVPLFVIDIFNGKPFVFKKVDIHSNKDVEKKTRPSIVSYFY